MGAALRAGVLFAFPLAASAAFLAWLNMRLYGSPFVSGYGPASQLFALDNIPSNAARYVRWLLDTQTPILLFGPGGSGRRGLAAAPEARTRPRRDMSGSASRLRRLVTACYLPYSTFDDWWYLRFLLPLIPVLLILAMAVLVQAGLARAGGASRADARRPWWGCSRPTAFRWPSSATPSPCSGSKAGTRRRARSPPESCLPTPSC